MATKEEEDLLGRNKRRSKGIEDMDTATQREQAEEATSATEKSRSYRDSVISHGRRKTLMGEDLDEEEVSDDDLIEESTDGTWVG